MKCTRCGQEKDILFQWFNTTRKKGTESIFLCNNCTSIILHKSLQLLQKDTRISIFNLIKDYCDDIRLFLESKKIRDQKSNDK